VYVKRGRNFAKQIAEPTGKTAFEINKKVSPGKKERQKEKRTKEGKREKRKNYTKKNIIYSKQVIFNACQGCRLLGRFIV